MCFAAAASPLRIPWRHAASLHLASSLQKTIEAINKEFNNNEAAGLGNTLLTFADEFSNMLATTAGGSKVGAGRVHCGVWRHFSAAMHKHMQRHLFPMGAQYCGGGAQRMQTL